MSVDRPGLDIRKATLRLGELRLANARGAFDVHFFRDLANETSAMAISTGTLELGEPLLARVHSSCVTSECLMGCDCDCAEQLEGALGTMAEAGRGVVFYLLQEGRGAGLTAKARDRMIVQASENRVNTFEAYSSMGLPADLRSYDIVAPMSRMLGIRAPIRLLTNNPVKAAAVGEALRSEKIELAGLESIHGPSSEFNRDYLSAKQDSGHDLAIADRHAGALPPFPVRVFEPFALPGNARRVVTASYFLPVALPADVTEEEGTTWFRMSVVYDRDSERESVLLSLGDGTTDAPLPMENTVTMGLLDRLPFLQAALGEETRESRAQGRPALERALLAIRERGLGAVQIHFDERDRSE